MPSWLLNYLRLLLVLGSLSDITGGATTVLLAWTLVPGLIAYLGLMAFACFGLLMGLLCFGKSPSAQEMDRAVSARRTRNHAFPIRAKRSIHTASLFAHNGLPSKRRGSEQRWR